MPDPERAAVAADRLSHLVPVLSKSLLVPRGANAMDVANAYLNVDPTGEQASFLMAYGHFCELMPEVHRGYYDVRGDAERGFTLDHPNQQFRDFEVRDFVLSHLSLAYASTPPVRFVRYFDDLAASVPIFDASKAEALLAFYYQHCLSNVTEPPLITDAGFREAAGVGLQEFHQFRAALHSLAEFCRGMAAAQSRRLSTSRLDETIAAEMVEWISVSFKQEFVEHAVGTMSGLEPEKVASLLRFFTWDVRPGQEASKHAGDGYFPPFLGLGDALLFNPDIVKLFVHSRNLLYALNRLDRQRFDNLVSGHLEPALIEAARSILTGFRDLHVVPNFMWGDGEFDLLVYSARENVVAHVQAKAALPPQGARMVAAVESRIKEGLNQLKRFRDLPREQADSILSTALGKIVRNVKIVDVLLSSAVFGTERVWSTLGDAVPLNLAILERVAHRLQTNGRDLCLGDLGRLASSELDTIVAKVRPQWAMKELTLAGTTIMVPMLDYDAKALASEHARLTQQQAWIWE